VRLWSERYPPWGRWCWIVGAFSIILALSVAVIFAARAYSQGRIGLYSTSCAAVAMLALCAGAWIAVDAVRWRMRGRR